MFFNRLEQYGENVACIENNKYITYKELLQDVQAFEEKLPEYKIILGVIAKPKLATIVAYLAALRKGHALLMLDDMEKARKIVKYYEVSYVFEPFEGGDYRLHKNSNIDYEVYDELALLLSTSGSTGSSKLVRLSYNNLQANCDAIVQYLCITADNRTITTLPLHYSFGLSILNTYLAIGASIVLTEDSIMTKSFWKLFTSTKVTSFSGVPYHYEMLRKVGFLNMSLPSLRVMTQAGGKLNPKFVSLFAEYCQKKTVEFFVMYGQTEATARISFLPPDDITEYGDTIGKAIPGGFLSIVDEKGNTIIDFGLPGELVYKGDNVMLGYAQNIGDLRKGDEMNGVLYTGDIAERVTESYYKIIGRKKRFLKMYGNRVNLDEIEDYVKSKGESVLVGGEDNKLMVAHLKNSNSNRIKKLISQFCHLHHSAIYTYLIDAFPVTSSGKIEYKKLFDTLKSGSYES